MNKILVALGVKYAAAKLDGKKTYFGGAVMMLVGVGKICTGFIGIIGNIFPDVTTPLDLDICTESLSTGIALFAAGLATVGIGHKVEKNG